MQNGTYEADWADGHYLFNVAKIDVLLELEEKCNAPFAVIWSRLQSRAWSVRDVYETIRLGLIGGGTAPLVALALVKRYVGLDPEYQAQRIGLLENALLALRICQATLVGFPGDDVGKKKDQVNPNASGGPPSTAPAPPLDSRPASSET
jgi:Phage tail tube protein, GTA-gp10